MGHSDAPRAKSSPDTPVLDAPYACPLLQNKPHRCVASGISWGRYTSCNATSGKYAPIWCCVWGVHVEGVRPFPLLATCCYGSPQPREQRPSVWYQKASYYVLASENPLHSPPPHGLTPSNSGKISRRVTNWLVACRLFSNFVQSVEGETAAFSLNTASYAFHP